MSVFLDGVAVQFYRGIGPDTQYIAPFTQMNFFVGANNAGKSIVLNLLAQRIFPNPNKTHAIAAYETYEGENKGTYISAIGYSNERLVNRITETRREPSHQEEESLLWLIENYGENNHIWFKTNNNIGFERLLTKIEPHNAIHFSNNGLTINLTSLLGIIQSYHSTDNLNNIVHSLIEILQKIHPNIYLIPAKRKLGKTGETFKDLSGEGLLDELQSLQNPDFNKQEDRKNLIK